MRLIIKLINFCIRIGYRFTGTFILQFLACGILFYFLFNGLPLPCNVGTEKSSGSFSRKDRSLDYFANSGIEKIAVAVTIRLFVVYQVKNFEATQFSPCNIININLINLATGECSQTRDVTSFAHRGTLLHNT